MEKNQSANISLNAHANLLKNNPDILAINLNKNNSIIWDVNGACMSNVYSTSLIKPHCISLSPQLQRQLFFRCQCLLAGHGLLIEVLIQAGSQVAAVLKYNFGGEVMTLGIAVTGFVLLQTFLWCLARHADIQAFQYTVELRVGQPKAGVFSKHFFGQLNDVDGVGEGHEWELMFVLLLMACYRNCTAGFW